MDIWIDGRAACRKERTGKGEWVLRAAEAVLRKAPLTLLTDDGPVPPAWDTTRMTLRRLPHGARWHRHARRIVLRERPDVYIAPTSFIVPAFLPKAIRSIPVIHDLIAFMPGVHDRKARVVEGITLGRALRNAACVCVTTETTRSDLLARFPFLTEKPVIPIYAGPFVDHPRLAVPDGRTIFCPGTLCPRKNQLRLIQAYALLPAELRRQFRLVLVGSRGWSDEEIVALAERTPGVEWKGYLPDRPYEDLLSTCTVLAFPSLYEGFGLPVLDALQRGIPVLQSGRGSLTEITGSCAVNVDPQSVEDIARGLERVLTDANLRHHLQSFGPERAAAFTWDKTADALLAAVHTACSTS